MSNSTNSQVLGAATALPATSGAGILLLNHANPVIVAGLFVVSIVSFIILIGNISRFIINNKRSK
jgi:hypothetical protein